MDEDPTEWAQRSRTAKNFQQLLSKTMKSSLKTSVCFRPEGFFITAEDDVDMHSPSGQVILRTN